MMVSKEFREIFLNKFLKQGKMETNDLKYIAAVIWAMIVLGIIMIVTALFTAQLDIP